MMSTPLSHHEVGLALGLHKSTVRRIERKALRKCREWCETHGYDPASLIPDYDAESEFDHERPVRHAQAAPILNLTETAE